MSGIAWPALMRFGLVDLGLAPDVFWALTPAELMFLGGGDPDGPVLSRSGLDSLMRQFPDTPTTGAMDG